MSQKVKPLEWMEDIRKTEKEKNFHLERIVAVCSEPLTKWILFLMRIYIYIYILAQILNFYL